VGGLPKLSHAPAAASTADQNSRGPRGHGDPVVFDNENLDTPFRHVATFEDGKAVEVLKPIPRWLCPALPAVSVR
jgi:hypothetical protein